MKIKMTQREFEERYSKASAAMADLGIALNLLNSEPVVFNTYEIPNDRNILLTPTIEIIQEIPAKDELVFVKDDNGIVIMKSMGYTWGDERFLQCLSTRTDCIGGTEYAVQIWCQVSDKSIHSDNWEPKWVENFA